MGGYVNVALYLDWIETHRNLPTGSTTPTSSKTSYHTETTKTPSTIKTSTADPTTTPIRTSTELPLTTTKTSWIPIINGDPHLIVVIASIVFAICKFLNKSKRKICQN